MATGLKVFDVMGRKNSDWGAMILNRAPNRAPLQTLDFPIYSYYLVLGV
jgi:hypothetical protein